MLVTVASICYELIDVLLLWSKCVKSTPIPQRRRVDVNHIASRVAVTRVGIKTSAADLYSLLGVIPRLINVTTKKFCTPWTRKRPNIISATV